VPFATDLRPREWSTPDHPHIKHWHLGTTARYVTPSSTFIQDAYRRAICDTLAELEQENP
jgi:hypothetical protein